MVVWGGAVFSSHQRSLHIPSVSVRYCLQQNRGLLQKRIFFRVADSLCGACSLPRALRCHVEGLALPNCHVASPSQPLHTL